MLSMSQRSILATVRLLRPSQAYKCLIVFLPALFHGGSTLGDHWFVLVRVAFAWLAASGLVYVFNDWMDREHDAKDSSRTHRPLASGEAGPTQVLLATALCLVALGFLLSSLDGRAALLIAGYLAINLAYSLGLKGQPGLQQACIAIGFWLRLISGSTPVVPIPLTAWAAVFTLGLAYFLNCLKAAGKTGHPQQQWAHGIGAALSGALSLVALCGVCFARASAGTLHYPELPPLFALVAMHRAAGRSSNQKVRREQSEAFLFDPVSWVAMAAFAASFLWG